MSRSFRTQGARGDFVEDYSLTGGVIMNRSKVLLVLLSTLMVSALYPDVSHAIPMDYTTTYHLRATPGDPFSDITCLLWVQAV